MKIEQIDIKKIKLNPNNPRLIKDDKYKKLVKSIQEFPQMLEIRPIVINDEMIIIGGNMRYRAAMEAGFKKIPVLRASNLTQEQQQEFIVKDNVSFGEWDFDLLANEFNSELLDDWGIDIPQIKFEDEEEREDLSDKITASYRIEVICKNEKEQEITYNKLIGEGYECRLLTL